MTSLLPTPEPPDPVEGALGHFEHSNWVKQALKNLDEGTVHSNGGVATGTLLADQVTIDNPEDQTARLNLKGNSFKSVLGMTSANSPRWELFLGDSTAEGGNNSGALFSLLAYADAGTARHTVLKADRNTGLVEVLGSPTAAKGVATKEYVDNAMPIGTIVAYGGSSAPAGWHLCNGTAHGSSALQAILGSANSPDLSGRFIVGSGTGYNPGATGGAASVTLTAEQSGTTVHGHGSGVGTSTANASHNHGTNTGGQSTSHSHSMTGEGQGGTPPLLALSDLHGLNSLAGWDGGGGDVVGLSKYSSNGSYRWAIRNDFADRDHSHAIGWDNAAHSHTFTTPASTAASASQSHENRPPYYALVYIIKKA